MTDGVLLKEIEKVKNKTVFFFVISTFRINYFDQNNLLSTINCLIEKIICCSFPLLVISNFFLFPGFPSDKVFLYHY